MNYTTTLLEESWPLAQQYIIDTYETGSYDLDSTKHQVSFVNEAMLAAFVAAHPQWLAH